MPISEKGPTHSHFIFSPLSDTLSKKMSSLRQLGTSSRFVDRHFKAPLQAANLTATLVGCTCYFALSFCLTPVRIVTKGPSQAFSSAWTMLKNSSKGVIQIAAIITTAVVGILFPKTIYQASSWLKQEVASSNTTTNKDPSRNNIIPTLIDDSPTYEQSAENFSNLSQNLDSIINQIKEKSAQHENMFTQHNQKIQAQKEEINELTNKIKELEQKNNDLSTKNSSLNYSLSRSKENQELKQISELTSKSPREIVNYNKKLTTEQGVQIIKGIQKLAQDSLDNQNDFQAVIAHIKSNSPSSSDKSKVSSSVAKEAFDLIQLKNDKIDELNKAIRHDKEMTSEQLKRLSDSLSTSNKAKLESLEKYEDLSQQHNDFKKKMRKLIQEHGIKKYLRDMPDNSSANVNDFLKATVEIISPSKKTGSSEESPSSPE